MGGVDPADETPQRAVRLAWVAVLALAAIPRLWLAWTDHGMVWPDEIYQSLEPAHRVVFGTGIQAWEFEVGARSWLLPGFVVVVWKLLSLAGVNDALTLVSGIKLVMAAISVFGVYGAMRLAQTIEGHAAALLAGVLIAVFPLSLAFGSRCIGDGVSGTLLVFSVLAALGRESAQPVLSGVLCGLAVFLKYQNGLVLLSVLIWLALTRRELLRSWLLGAVSTGWLGGLLDWATWGVPFQSFRTYLEYNVLNNQSVKYGFASPAAYALWGWSLTGPALAAIALGIGLVWRRALAPLLVAVVFVLVHAAVPHKEMRFLLPVVPLLLGIAGAGLAYGLRRVRATPLVTGTLAAALAGSMAQHAAAATYADIGEYDSLPAGEIPVWHALEGVNRLLALTGRQKNACGAWVAGIRTPFVGGYTYLHRDIPFLWGAQAYNELFANYLVMPLETVSWPLGTRPVDTLMQPPPNYLKLAQSRGWALYGRPGGCMKLPAEFDDRRIFN